MVSQGSRNSTYITGGVSKISASDKERKKKKFLFGDLLTKEQTPNIWEEKKLKIRVYPLKS